MSVFGNKEIFAIEYSLVHSPYQEEKLLKESWGTFKLWIEGRDICEYMIGDSRKQYEWNLIYVVEWLCENLECVVGYDPFPLPVKGQNLLELLQESNKFESEDDSEFYLWYQARSAWMFRHSWFSNRAGSTLADVYFRRIDDDVEVSWDNSFFEEEQIYFINPKGTYIIPKVLFRKILLDFLHDILNKLEADLGRNVKMGDHSINDLWEMVKILE